MNILGVGPMEFLLILVIMLLVLGPRNMVATGRKIGVFIRKVIRSPYWSQLMQTQQEIRDLPTKLVREAGIEDELEEIKKLSDDVKQQVNIEKDVQEINQITQDVAKEVDTQIGKRDAVENVTQIQQTASAALAETAAIVQSAGTAAEPPVEASPAIPADQETPPPAAPEPEAATPSTPPADASSPEPSPVPAAKPKSSTAMQRAREKMTTNPAVSTNNPAQIVSDQAPATDNPPAPKLRRLRKKTVSPAAPEGPGAETAAPEQKTSDE